MSLEYLLFGVVGLVFGSFGNVIIHRLPSQTSIHGRSRCPTCQELIAWYHLIPVISFVLLRGRCNRCQQAISWRYPTVELSSGLLFVLAYHLTGLVLIAAPLALCLWLLLLISIIDVQTQTISDALSLPLIVLALLYSGLLGTLTPWGPLLGGGFFFAQWLLSCGRWIGSGDILLGIGIGALFGTWPFTGICLLLTYAVGALVVLGLLLAGRATRRDYVAFAPFIAIGVLLTLLFEQHLVLTFL